MRELKVNDKIGYLNPKSGNYKYVPIEQIDILHPTTNNPAIKLRIVFKGYNDHIYFEELENIYRWTKEASLDFKSFKPLLKLRICK